MKESPMNNNQMRPDDDIGQQRHEEMFGDYSSLSAAPAVTDAQLATPYYFSLSGEEGDWYECPDDCCILEDLPEVAVGTEYTVTVCHMSKQTYRITKVPDDIDDDTLVELVSDTRPLYQAPQPSPAQHDVKRLMEENEKLKDLINDIFNKIPPYGEDDKCILSERILDKWRGMTNEFGRMI